MKRMMAIAMIAMMLVGCGEATNEPVQTTAQSTTVETATTTVTEQTTTETTANETTVATEPEYTDSDIADAWNWSNLMWNKCVDIEAYVTSGTNCSGKELDIEFYIEGAKIEYEKKAEHDAVIHALDDTDSEQRIMILAWDKAFEQIDALLDKAFTEMPRPNDESYEFDIELLRQYKKQFDDSYRGISYNGSKTGDSKRKFVFAEK